MTPRSATLQRPAAVVLAALVIAGMMTSLHRISMSSRQPAPAFVLPAPTGPALVGTTGWRVTDEAREETFAERGVHREVGVLRSDPERQRSPLLAGAATFPEVRVSR